MLQLDDETQVGMCMSQIVACQSANIQEYLPYLWADRRNKALPTRGPGKVVPSKAATLGNLGGSCASAVQVPTPTQQTESQCCCGLQAAVGRAISSGVRAPLVHPPHATQTAKAVFNPIESDPVSWMGASQRAKHDEQ
jgi:hypothetical protein